MSTSHNELTFNYKLYIFNVLAVQTKMSKTTIINPVNICVYTTIHILKKCFAENLFFMCRYRSHIELQRAFTWKRYGSVWHMNKHGIISGNWMTFDLVEHIMIVWWSYGMDKNSIFALLHICNKELLMWFCIYWSKHFSEHIVMFWGHTICHPSNESVLNIYRSEQNAQNFAGNVFIYIFLIWNFCIFLKISLKCMPIRFAIVWYPGMPNHDLKDSHTVKSLI